MEQNWEKIAAKTALEAFAITTSYSQFSKIIYSAISQVHAAALDEGWQEHEREWKNELAEVRAAALSEGRAELEKEYAHGSDFIKAGEHIYIRLDAANKYREKAVAHALL